MTRAVSVSLSSTAGSVDCPRCGALSAIDRCWNCGARYVPAPVSLPTMAGFIEGKGE